MCGIVGLIRTDGAPVSPACIDAMTDALAHRGPDGRGVHIDGNVALGHRRLSIIDLNGGTQPLSNEDGSVWVTFNGEIYNYRELRRELQSAGHTFHTASDTEVLVHGYEQWGDQLPTKLRGMFAFAIWDSRRRKLLLARDRVGIKPLYYLQQPGLFAFASEMQAFRQLDEFRGTVDLQAIDLFLHYQYIPAPFSIFREVRKLPTAHYLVIDVQNQDQGSGQGVCHGPTRYWDLEFRPDRSLNEAGWIERIDAALRETVSAHLVSDVPFGAFLSGGIDSSTVVAYMSQILAAPVKAFTIGHPIDEYDERRWAREAAKACGADYYEEVMEPDALDLLPELVRHYGEPFADSSAIPTFYVSRLARQHVKMVLSGDGGDELFAGYYAYPAILWEHEPRLGAYHRAKHFVANGARGLGLWPRRASPADSKYQRTAAFEPELRRTLWKPEFRHLLAATRAQFQSQYDLGSRNELLHRLQYFDVFNYIPFDNLTKVDVASMCHGLEVRVPLLDHVFLETAAQVPPELKLKESGADGVGRFGLTPGRPVVGKYLLKKNAERFFSAEFLNREKRGFEVPIRDWFCGPYREELEQRLLGPQSRLHDFFDGQQLRLVLDQGRESRVGAWKAWALLVLEEWFEQSSQTKKAYCG